MSWISALLFFIYVFISDIIEDINNILFMDWWKIKEIIFVDK